LLSAEALPAILASFLILVLSLSFHEAAHAWTADRLGDPTARMLGRLTLNPLAHIDWIGTVLFPLIAMYTGAPLIGWAKPVPVSTRNLRDPRRDFALVALAGPVSNLILAAGGALVVAAIRMSDPDGLPGASLPATLAKNVVALNVLLAVFNLFPIPPLDGGNVLAGFAPLPVARLVGALRPYGFLLLYVLMLTGIIGAIAWPIQRTILEWLL
jgi:Zn-dependent protease